MERPGLIKTNYERQKLESIRCQVSVKRPYIIIYLCLLGSHTTFRQMSKNESKDVGALFGNEFLWQGKKEFVHILYRAEWQNCWVVISKFQNVSMLCTDKVFKVKTCYLCWVMFQIERRVILALLFCLFCANLRTFVLVHMNNNY